MTRFLGLPSSEIGDKLENTGYSAKRVFRGGAVAARHSRQLSLSYRRSEQEDAHRYDQEIGGNGQYRSEFGPQRLDFGFVRFETARGRLVRQRVGHGLGESPGRGRLEQARPGQRIDQQVNTTTAVGYSLQATHDWSPRLAHDGSAARCSTRTSTARATFSSRTAQPCARVPTSRTAREYRSVGLFLQQTADMIPDKLTLRGGIALRALPVHEHQGPHARRARSRTFRCPTRRSTRAACMPPRRT